MNILRWNRKSQKKIRFKSIILVIFSLIMTTFAWFAYSKIINPTLNMHIASWDLEYYIGTEKKTNPIGIEIDTLYPTMEPQKVMVDIYNNGETLIDLYYRIQAVSIIGTTYEVVQPGGTPTSENYIALAEPKLETNASGEQVYRGVITNDITKFPFTIETELSAEIGPVTVDAQGNETQGEAYMKITANWIGDNDALDSEWGYKVGEYFEANPGATSAISIVLSIDSYQAENQNRVSINIAEILERTPTTRPYLPTGFTRKSGTNLDTGIVITDESGNEYVWIEVPKSATVYGTDGLGITEFSSSDYTKIETALRNYVSEYSTRADVHKLFDAIGMGEDAYGTLKQKMLKSIYQNGGFYIGRYETGYETSNGTYRNSAGETTQQAVIKPNAYPYNYLTCAQAHLLATGMAPSGYTSSLMFGLQWDLVMKYLQTKGTDPNELKVDSTAWGNYKNNEYSLTKENAKYMTTQWLTDLPYEKKTETQVLLSTGANTGFSRQNIYDLAGNLSEWTYNIEKDASNNHVGGNGGNYLGQGNDASATASAYGTFNTLESYGQVGFRVALFVDNGTGAVDVSSVWGDDGSGSGESGDATEISFNIDGVTYTAEQGMTWGQWCENVLSQEKFEVREGQIYSTVDSTMAVRYDDVGTYVHETESIVANYSYVTKEGVAGGNSGGSEEPGGSEPGGSEPGGSEPGGSGGTGGSDENEGAITSITLDKTSEELNIGDTLTLTATINADAEEELIWESSNPAVATVEANTAVALLRDKDIKSSLRVAGFGESIENLFVLASTGKTKTATITAISAGTTTITARNTDGTIVKSCTVTVVEEAHEQITLASVTNVNIGEYIDLGNNIVGGEETTDDWIILYVEEDKVYAILADYLPNSTNYATNANLDTDSTYGVYSETNRNILLNGLKTTSNWQGLANGISKEKATVTGSPTAELLMKSYNAKNSTNVDYTTKPTLNLSYLNIHSSDGCIGFWLSSGLTGNNKNVWCVTSAGKVSNTGYGISYNGIRPVVCLSSDINAIKNGNLWIIQK